MATFYLKRNDTLPALQATLLGTGGTAFDLSPGYTVKLIIETSSGNSINRNMTVVTAASGIVQYAWQAGDWTDLTPGEHRMEYQATLGSGIVTFPNSTYDTLSITSDLG